jgi:phage gp45-like
VSDALLKKLNAKINNLFSLASFQKRYDDEKIQVKTVSGRVLEKKESFPYGFIAKAKTGMAFAFCPGGNFDGFEIMPLVANDDIKLPKLKIGDSALYTESGGWIIAREGGTIELFGTDEGGLVKAAELKSQLEKLSARVDGIINALNSSPVTPTDGGASFKAGICATLASLIKRENFSNLENKKVLHGTGK